MTWLKLLTKNKIMKNKIRKVYKGEIDISNSGLKKTITVNGISLKDLTKVEGALKGELYELKSKHYGSKGESLGEILSKRCIHIKNNNYSFKRYILSYYKNDSIIYVTVKGVLACTIKTPKRLNEFLNLISKPF